MKWNMALEAKIFDTESFLVFFLKEPVQSVVFDRLETLQQPLI